MQLETLRRADIGRRNTPLEFLPQLTEKIGKGKLYCKRDDLSDLAMGGNKTRKLEYLVQYALDHGYTTLLTFGGVQTNHGRLTVAAAKKYGLKSVLVLKGAKPEYCSGNLLLDRLMDTELVFVDTSCFDGLPEEERKKKADAFLAECTEKVIKAYEEKGEKVFSIPVGGQGVIGAAGYLQMVPELIRQMEEQKITARYVVCGYGSTGTFAGLWAGAKYYHAPFEVIAIPVEPDYRSKEETAAFINTLCDTYQLGFSCKPEELWLEEGPAGAPYYGAGYNQPDEKTWKYIKLLAETEAIFTDPCYTGKVFYGFADMVANGIIPSGEAAIFVHTGGAPGLWSKEHLDFIQNTLWSGQERIRVFKA